MSKLLYGVRKAYSFGSNYLFEHLVFEVIKDTEKQYVVKEIPMPRFHDFNRTIRKSDMKDSQFNFFHTKDKAVKFEYDMLNKKLLTNLEKIEEILTQNDLIEKKLREISAMEEKKND